MKMNFNSIVLIALLFASCKSKKDEQITGVYAHERAFEKKNLNTGKVMGKVIVRDTILLTEKESGYQIENRVWMKRDYDQNGWQRTFENTMYTHAVTYDKTDQSLNTEMGLYKPLYLDFENGLLYYSKEGEKKWKKTLK